MPQPYFQGKVIWVTGASSGIGEALVFLFALQGAKFVLSARHESSLQEVANNAGLPEENYLILPFDLMDTSGAEDYVKIIVEKFGRIDFLINNGGISQRAKALETSVEVERALLEINYFAQINLSKAVVKQMIKQGWGHITVVSSIAGKFGFYLRSSYSAAKHALQGYFESLRLEVEENHVKILLVCPGKIKTQISNNAVLGDGSKHDKMDASHKDAMTAEECALKILRAIEKNKQEILIGRKEIISVYIKRFFPSLLYKILKEQSPY